MQTVQPLPLDQRLTLLKVLAHATPTVQVIIYGLILSILASMAIWAVQLAGGRNSPAERAEAALGFLSAVTIAAPLFGMTAAAYGLLDTSIGIANETHAPELTRLAPGFAEESLCLLLGFLAAALAAAFRAHLRMRAAEAA